MQTVPVHQRYHAVDSSRVQLRVLGVVDGDVGLAAGAVACQARTGHLAAHGRGTDGQPARVRPAPRLRLGVRGAPAPAFAPQGHGAVLGHQRHQRTGRGPGCGHLAAPAQRAPGDGQHRHARRLQRRQGVGGRGLQPRVVRQRVVDVGEHATQRRPAFGRALGQRRGGNGGGVHPASLEARQRGPPSLIEPTVQAEPYVRLRTGMSKPCPRPTPPFGLSLSKPCLRPTPPFGLSLSKPCFRA